MSSDFSFEITKTETANIVVFFKGDLNEDSTLPDFDELSKYSQVTIDLKALSFINSAGIKKWIFFFDQFSSHPEIQLNFVNCPKFISDPMVMIDSILPKNARVSSFLVPFYCKKCDQDFTELKSIEEIKRGVDELVFNGELSCEKFPSCKKYHEVDVLPDAYEMFTKF